MNDFSSVYLYGSSEEVVLRCDQGGLSITRSHWSHDVMSLDGDTDHSPGQGPEHSESGDLEILF